MTSPSQCRHLADAAARVNPVYDSTYWAGWRRQRAESLVRQGLQVEHCVLCDNEHDVCRFVSGSLRCTSSPCRNPHHRPTLASYLTGLGVPAEVLNALGVV